jgi:hypothetical protein
MDAVDLLLMYSALEAHADKGDEIARMECSKIIRELNELNTERTVFIDRRRLQDEETELFDHIYSNAEEDWKKAARFYRRGKFDPQQIHNWFRSAVDEQDGSGRGIHIRQTGRGRRYSIKIT